MSDPVRIGLIGFGFAGRTFHAPLIRATEGCVLTAIATRQGEPARAAAPEAVIVATPEELFAWRDIELVVVATPNDTHAPLARAALAAGKHVVVDKPFALNLSEARTVAQAARDAGRLLSVFHNRRWDSDFLSVRAAIEAGRVGAVTHFESHIDRFRPEVRDRWRETAGPGAGLWYDLGPHLIDQALLLFGALETVQLNLATQRAGAVVDDWAHAILSYGPGLRVILQATMLARAPSARFLVHGAGGSVLKREADQQEAQVIAGLTPGAETWGHDPDALICTNAECAIEEVLATAGDQRRYYAAIAKAVRGAGANPVTPQEALAVMAVLQAGIDSARSGRAQTPSFTEEERAAFA